MMKPAMRTLSPASTRMRVEMFARCEFGVGVAMGVAVGLAVAVAVGVAVAAAVADAVGVAVAVAVAVGVAVAIGVAVGVGEGCGAVCTKTLASSRLSQPTLADQTKPRSCPVERMTRGLPVASKFTQPTLAL